ncbi:MAG: GAF domain-containing protein [Labilithrix sp.]|nr:GAF domain-containing protein [Labilithrix sp.]MCW5810110.1 GAF domain-containing protein [Labilithrix sp.]
MLLRGRRSAHWLFAAFSTCVAFWYVSQSLAGLLEDPARSLFDRATTILTVLLPQFAVHLFHSITPLEHTSGIGARLPRISAALGIPMLAVALSPFERAGAALKALALGSLYFYVVGVLAVALVSLWRRGEKSPSRAVRDRIRFLASVGALAMTFTLADFVAFLGVNLPPIGAVLAVVFLFVLAESLTRPRLADLYELSGRLLVSTALAFALAGIFYVFITYIGRFGAMYLNAVLAAIVFLVLFEPLEHEFETRVNKFFFRERYDLESSVGELRRRLAHTLESAEMVEVVISGLEQSRRVTTCAVYLRDPDGNGFDLVGSIGPAPATRLESLAMRPLTDRLQLSMSLEELAREADAAPHARELLAPVLTAVDALGPLKSSVILAIRGDGEELVGLLCVADDRVKDAFTPEEIALLETIAAQMGVAIANSRIYDRMKERDRLAALGSMAAGLAHEVKNPLGAIKGAAQLLEEVAQGAKDQDPTTAEFLGIILEETDRLNRVVGSFLDYARPHAGNPVPLDINAAVRRSVQILSSQKTDDVDIRLDLADTLPRASIDPEKLRQVLINLVQNAGQAMNGKGKVTITTSTRKASRVASWVHAPPTTASGRLMLEEQVEVVDIAVADTGPGISAKVIKNLFVPFFTTKEKGTGLGLAISQSIVQNAGGSIQVQSQQGSGTKFTITLPASNDVLATPPPGSLSSVPARAAGE